MLQVSSTCTTVCNATIKVTQDTIFKVAGLVKSECEELEIRGIDVLNRKMEVIVVYMLSLMHMSSAEARTLQK